MLVVPQEELDPETFLGAPPHVMEDVLRFIRVRRDSLLQAPLSCLYVSTYDVRLIMDCFCSVSLLAIPLFTCSSPGSSAPSARSPHRTKPPPFQQLSPVCPSMLPLAVSTFLLVPLLHRDQPTTFPLADVDVRPHKRAGQIRFRRWLPGLHRLRCHLARPPAQRSLDGVIDSFLPRER